LLLLTVFISSSISYSNSALQTSNSFDQSVLSTKSMDLWEVWRYNQSDNIWTVPAISDLYNDSQVEIILTTAEDDAKCICFDIYGNILWSRKIGRPGRTNPKIADLNKDGLKEIIFCAGGYLFCVSAAYNGSMKSYELRWQIEANIMGAVCLADINNDSNFEIILGAPNNKIICLDYNGYELWSYQTNVSVSGSTPAVADLDSDGYLEIYCGSGGVSTSNGSFYCLYYNGTLKWSKNPGQIILASPSFGDFNNDDELEVVLHTKTGDTFCFDHNGTQIWKHSVNSETFSSPLVVDLENDGFLEIIFGAKNEYVYCLNNSGGIKWQYKTNGWILSTASASDLNNDGNIEVLIGSYDNNLYCINANGSVLFSYYVSGFHTREPAIFDLNRDGILEIIFTTSDGLFCLELAGVTQSGKQHWYCGEGSIYNTGWFDSDQDYLDDLTENWFYDTDPQNNDSDSDGFTDFDEISFGTDPNDPADYPVSPPIPIPTNNVILFDKLTNLPCIVFIVTISIISSKRRKNNFK